MNEDNQHYPQQVLLVPCVKLSDRKDVPYKQECERETSLFQQVGHGHRGKYATLLMKTILNIGRVCPRTRNLLYEISKKKMW